MKIKPQTESLSKILEIATRAVKHNASVAVLSSILFDADEENSTIKISATNMELSISVTAGGCEVEEGGKSAIRASLLANVVKSINDEYAEIQSTDSDATLSTENGSYTINAYKAEDFPKLPEFPAGKDSFFVVSAKALAKAIENVLPFASNDHTRPALTGALVTFEDGELHVATTDSYRLGVATKALSGAPTEKVSQIIPARALKEVARLASMTEKIKVAITENQAMFSAQGVTISTRLIGANFPEYKRLMPPEFEKTFRINRKSFLESLRRVNLFCANTNPPTPVRLSFNTGQESLMGDELVIAGSNSEIGQGREIISYSKEPEGEKTEANDDGNFVTAFNPSYLMAALTTAAGEDVLFKFNESLKPAMVFPAETAEEDPDLKMLLMPMRDPAAEENATGSQKQKESKESKDSKKPKASEESKGSKTSKASKRSEESATSEAEAGEEHAEDPQDTEDNVPVGASQATE